MIDKLTSMDCQRRCWLIAAVLGAVLSILLWISGWGFFGGLFAGIILAAALGYLLNEFLCNDHPDLAFGGRKTSAPAAPAAPAPVAAPEPAAEPQPAAALAPAPAPEPAPAPKPEPEPAPAPKPAPAAAAPAAKPGAEDAAPASASKPALLPVAREGGPDDLKKIKGVGPKLEALLHKLGVYHFDQIAAWSDAEIDWIDHHLEGFRGRARRDGWVEQAQILAHGGTTDFADRVKKGDVY